MYGTKIKNYANDLKGLLFLLGIILATIIWNLDYFFSDETLNEVKIVEKKELSLPENTKAEE